MIYGQVDDNIKWYPAPGSEDESNKVVDTINTSPFDRTEVKTFSYSLIEKTISERLLILSSIYITEDKEGNRYIDRRNKNNSFYSLGINVENGYVVCGNISLKPWLIDTTYENEKDFHPILKSIKYKHINEKDKYTDLSYENVDDKYLISKINRDSGIKVSKFKEVNATKGEDLILVSAGLYKDKVKIYYDSYNEIVKNLKLDPSVFFDQYYGSVLFDLTNESDRIKISLVGIMGYDKENYNIQKISSSDENKMKNAADKFKKKKNKKSKNKKK